MKQIHFAILFLAFQCNAQVNLPAFVRDSLEGYVNRALVDWQIPGCAVAIIKDGQIILAKGFGVRDIANGQKVDEHSLFMIASNSKAVTGITIAKLENEQKLSLDDKVNKWIPWFKLKDPHASAMVTIKDVLSHRIGFETFQGDFCHWATNTSREDVIRRMALIEPVYGFRDKWGYCNAGFVVGGEIIRLISGMPWEDYIQQNYFTPLGMTETLPLSTGFDRSPNHCTAHTIYLDSLIRLKSPLIDNLAPAASICSSVADWSKWVQLILNEGKWNGKQLIPEAAIAKSMTPFSVRGNFKPRYNTGHFSLYGLGWDLNEYSGRRLVSHTGGADGFVSSVLLVPEEKLGIIVFTNSDANSFYQALKWEILDAYLGLPYRNYSALYHTFYAKNQELNRKWHQSIRDSVKNAGLPDLALKQYAGLYLNPVYGKIELKEEGKNLRMTMEHHPDQSALLEYMGSNRFLCTYTNPTLGIEVFPFEVKKKRVKSFRLRCADFVEFTSYEFIKKH